LRNHFGNICGGLKENGTLKRKKKKGGESTVYLVKVSRVRFIFVGGGEKEESPPLFVSKKKEKGESSPLTSGVLYLSEREEGEKTSLSGWGKEKEGGGAFQRVSVIHGEGQSLRRKRGGKRGTRFIIKGEIANSIAQNRGRRGDR